MKIVNFFKLFLIFCLINFQRTVPCCSSHYKYDDYLRAKTREQKITVALIDILKYLEGNKFYQSFDELTNNLDSKRKYLKNFIEYMQDMPSCQNLGNSVKIDLIVNNYLILIQTDKEILKENHNDSRFSLLKKAALGATLFKESVSLAEVIETFEQNMRSKAECCANCLCCCCCLTDSCKQSCVVSCIQNDCAIL